MAVGHIAFTNVGIQSDCLLCGQRPVSEDGENRALPMAHVVGGDVNWGEQINICVRCIAVMADFIGRVDEVKHAKVKKELHDLSTKHAATVHDLATARDQIRRMVDGARAKKEARQTTKEVENG